MSAFPTFSILSVISAQLHPDSKDTKETKDSKDSKDQKSIVPKNTDLESFLSSLTFDHKIFLEYLLNHTQIKIHDLIAPWLERSITSSDEYKDFLKDFESKTIDYPFYTASKQTFIDICKLIIFIANEKDQYKKKYFFTLYHRVCKIFYGMVFEWILMQKHLAKKEITLELIINYLYEIKGDRISVEIIENIAKDIFEFYKTLHNAKISNIVEAFKKRIKESFIFKDLEPNVSGTNPEAILGNCFVSKDNFNIALFFNDDLYRFEAYKLTGVQRATISGNVISTYHILKILPPLNDDQIKTLIACGNKIGLINPQYPKILHLILYNCIASPSDGTRLTTTSSEQKPEKINYGSEFKSSSCSSASSKSKFSRRRKQYDLEADERPAKRQKVSHAANEEKEEQVDDNNQDSTEDQPMTTGTTLSCNP